MSCLELAMSKEFSNDEGCKPVNIYVYDLFIRYIRLYCVKLVTFD